MLAILAAALGAYFFHSSYKHYERNRVQASHRQFVASQVWLAAALVIWSLQ